MRKGVQKIYTEVAGTYELVNHILTFGFDIIWRRTASRKAALHGGRLWLDICSGTGEMAKNLSRQSAPDRHVFCADFSFPMLSRAKAKKFNSPVSFVLTDVGRLPFPTNSIDLITISFATRNLNTRKEEILAYLEEFHRVLKPGGCFINLETSQPKSKILRRLFHFYIKLAVRPVGSILSGSEAGYKYLSHTIPRFYSGEEFTRLLIEAGLIGVDLQKYLFGIAALHTAFKPGPADQTD